MNVQLLFMKGKARLLMVLAAFCPLGLTAQGIAGIIESLRSVDCYRAKADYSVSLPQNDAEVVYHLDLMSSKAEGDTLAPCRYLIDWTLETPSGLAGGFSAYFDGSHYRYRGDRLQEYHTEWDEMPFHTVGRNRGVQRMAQFVELLPAFIAERLDLMARDSAYTVKVEPKRVFDGSEVVPVTAVMTLKGEDVMEVEYLFDSSSLLPVRITTESNPGSITEQSILVNLRTESDPVCGEMSEAALVAAYPEVFEKYRESNFRIENLRGLALPTFALPSATGGERFIHHRGDSFRAPTVIALLDPSTGMNSRVIEDLRSAMDRLEVSAELVFAFTGTNPELVEEAVSPLRPGEHLLLNARSLVRDCGAASLPVTIVAGRDGMVQNVVLGFNNDLADIVLQSVILSDKTGN